MFTVKSSPAVSTEHSNRDSRSMVAACICVRWGWSWEHLPAAACICSWWSATQFVADDLGRLWWRRVVAILQNTDTHIGHRHAGGMNYLHQRRWLKILCNLEGRLFQQRRWVVTVSHFAKYRPAYSPLLINGCMHELWFADVYETGCILQPAMSLLACCW